MNGKESYDGEAGESYIQPASNRKGRRELPGWRDPDWSRQNWAYVRKAGRRYFIALMLPGLALLWFAGYALGYFDGVQWARANSSASASNSAKESNND